MSKKSTSKELEQQISELTEALQRERADSQNIRRLHEQQMASLQTMVKSGVIKDLLPVIDNMERALAHVPKDLEASDYVKGVAAIIKQFEKTLDSIGVKRIKTVGMPFDPELHEAVSVEDGDGNNEIVSEELQAGYHMENHVIRHAMVRVKRVK